MKYKIYKLINLDTNEIIYVGITKKSLGSRRSKHINYMKSYDIENFGIKLIEETDDNSRESYWIKYYKDNGYKLLNKNNGIKNKEKEKKIRKRLFCAKKYYLDNKEKIDNNNKEYQEKNKERLKEYRKNYYKEYRKKIK